MWKCDTILFISDNSGGGSGVTSPPPTTPHSFNMSPPEGCSFWAYKWSKGQTSTELQNVHPREEYRYSTQPSIICIFNCLFTKISKISCYPKTEFLCKVRSNLFQWISHLQHLTKTSSEMKYFDVFISLVDVIENESEVKTNRQ